MAIPEASKQQRASSPSAEAPERWPRRAQIAARTAAIVAVGLLPAYLLLRLPVTLHQAHHWNTWLALFVGVALCAAALTLLASVLWHRVLGVLPRRTIVVALLGAVPFFATCSLVHLPAEQAKSEAVRGRYASLQPILRLAVGSLRWLDEDLVLTDVSRTPAAYTRMGLPPRRHSAHYVQQDGYVRAVDVRTLGRGAIRNALVRLYFEAMGFETLRHRGTADHLHVELPARARAAD